MPTTTPTVKNDSTHRVRPRYCFLGIDEAGGTHLYRTVDETIFAFDADGRREYRFDIDGIAVEDYLAHVTDARGWADLRFGFDAYADRIAALVE
ncbi:MAG: hypothetical protein RI560_07995 [Natronomonas sp.]|uniref:hypothetical protein n=1 Tax=Natronomonas sp. TaxID=2184060 RepID=UPI0028703A96|nr:hypothetical protein [Natronomonas sp.]MDR9381596.1 hypothetical protein [Natronomonas sp.]MDR9431514.1 hypothetical protein [Natronomonas sp.]